MHENVSYAEGIVWRPNIRLLLDLYNRRFEPCSEHGCKLSCCDRCVTLCRWIAKTTAMGLYMSCFCYDRKDQQQIFLSPALKWNAWCVFKMHTEADIAISAPQDKFTYLCPLLLLQFIEPRNKIMSVTVYTLYFNKVTKNIIGLHAFFTVHCPFHSDIMR